MSKFNIAFSVFYIIALIILLTAMIDVVGWRTIVSIALLAAVGLFFLRIQLNGKRNSNPSGKEETEEGQNRKYY